MSAPFSAVDVDILRSMAARSRSADMEHVATAFESLALALAEVADPTGDFGGVAQRIVGNALKRAGEACEDAATECLFVPYGAPSRAVGA